MRCYIISFTLRKDKDYTPLYKAIKSYGTWARVLEFTWAVVTEQPAKEIRDYLKKFLDESDKIFVVRSGAEAAWKDVICSNDWLKKNL